MCFTVICRCLTTILKSSGWLTVWLVNRKKIKKKRNGEREKEREREGGGEIREERIML